MTLHIEEIEKGRLEQQEYPIHCPALIINYSPQVALRCRDSGVSPIGSQDLVDTHSQRKKDKTDSPNEFYLGTRSNIGEGDKSGHMPMDTDNHADTHSSQRTSSFYIKSCCCCTSVNNPL